MLREGTVIEGLRCGAGADGGRKKGMKGAIAKADELAAGNKRQLYPGQFVNAENPVRPTLRRQGRKYGKIQTEPSIYWLGVSAPAARLRE